MIMSLYLKLIDLICLKRQQVCAIPVTTVNYNWKGNNGQFYVCGIENKVYAPDYPQQFCCGCDILWGAV